MNSRLRQFLPPTTRGVPNDSSAWSLRSSQRTVEQRLLLRRRGQHPYAEDLEEGVAFRLARKIKSYE